MNTKRTAKATMIKLTLTAILLMLGVVILEAQDIEGGGTKAPEIGGNSKAEKLYKSLSYYEAIPVYEHYLEQHDSATAMAHLGDCYRLTSRYDKAAYWYNKALTKGIAEPKYKLYLAQMEQIAGNYEEAAKWYGKYQEEVPEDRRTANELDACINYGQYLLTRDRYTVKNLDINSPGYDFSSALSQEGLLFCSSRDSSQPIGREHTWTGTSFFDIYSVKGDKNNFSKPQKLKGDASTKYHEAAICFTEDYKKVYYTRNNYYNNKVKTSTDKVVKLKIYESEVDGNKWKDDKDFPFNNDEYSVGHPALTSDGNTMYFVSDMPGGFGATDIYVTSKDGEIWSTPKNLGPEVNTEGREMFPVVDKEGELYFASDGHGGLGGLDNFRVKQNSNTGKYGKVRNIGAPINSSYDDFGMHYGRDKSYGYFSSNRPDGHGLDDIYSFTDDGISLEGIVVDAQSGAPICSSTVEMNSKSTKIAQGTMTTECDGEFEFSVVRNTDYCFVGIAEGYQLNDSICASTKGVSAGGKVFVEIRLTKKHDYAMSITVEGKTPEGPKALSNAKILLSSQCEGWTKEYNTDATGKICEIVRCDCEYIVVANAQGYLPGSTTVIKDNQECVIDRKCGINPKEVKIILENIATTPTDTNVISKEIELKDIYYDFDKWYIRQESERELTKLLGFMQENPDAIVEIGSHTDSRAPFDYNMKLSQRRAQSVVDWLIARGISKDKLKARGYGETQLKNGCTDGVQCTEYEHQRNRRTTFRVEGRNINLKSLERLDMQVDPCKVCPF